MIKFVMEGRRLTLRGRRWGIRVADEGSERYAMTGGEGGGGSARKGKVSGKSLDAAVLRGVLHQDRVEGLVIAQHGVGEKADP